MSTATRGTVLAGRYRLEERIQGNPDGALWRAVDSTLDRRVCVQVLRPAHPFAADVADAARRAALVDDPRLVRVLDVGSDGDVGFVVSEHVDGDNLASLVERSPLAPNAVRRLVGEVAEGLDGAASRGLHHLRLTPRSVIVCRDGSVKIIGTAVEAAAAGLEPDHAATASRVDAVALVGLLYSGLTGRWPLGDAGFPPAPRGDGGGPVPPADLVQSIPNDLDTLCVVTLAGSDDGPRSPAEVARELAPWPSAEEAPLRAAARRIPAEAPTGPPGPDSPLKIRSRPLIKRGGSKPARPADAATGAGTSGAASGAATAGAAAAGAPASAAETAPTANGVAGPAANPAPRRSASLFPTPSVAATGSLPIPKEPTSSKPRRMDSLFTQQTVYPGTPAEPPKPPAERSNSGPSNPAFAPFEPFVAGPRPGPVPRPADITAKTDPDTATGPPEVIVGGPPDPASATPPGPVPREAARPAAPVRPKLDPAESLLPWGPNWPGTTGGGSDADATGPFPIIIPAEAPPRRQSRLVIFAITVVLVLGLLVAAFSLRDLGSSSAQVRPAETGVTLPSSTVGAVEPTTAPPTTEPEPTETSAQPSRPPAAPVSIGAIRAIDPQGDGDEDTRSTPLAVDGDSATSWGSQTYSNASFGGLKKGVGLSLKLTEKATVTSATIELNGTGGSVELRTASGPDLASSDLVGRGTIKNGKVTVTARGAKPSKYVILWFTKLPSVGGDYKLEVSEVRLK